MVLPLTQLFSAAEVASYWDTLPQTEAPYLGPELWPAQKQLGTKMEWVKGAQGGPVALRLSNFDTNAIPRDFKGFTRKQMDMAYYKEGWYIDEEQRQQLLLLMSGNNQAYLDMVTQHVYDQPASLIRGGLLASEIARMQALTTGMIHVTGNGSAYDIDFGVPANHKAGAAVAWDDPDSAKPFDDFKRAKDTIAKDTGTTITRVVMNQATFDKLTATKQIQERLKPVGAGSTYPVLDEEVTSFLQNKLKVQIAIYDKFYNDVSGTLHRFIPDDTVVFLPAMTLGKTGYGTTPAEADLMAGQTDVTKVSVVETGISILETVKSDPVQIGGIVSQLTMPSFEAADKVYIMDVSKGTASSVTTNGSSTSTTTPTDGFDVKGDTKPTDSNTVAEITGWLDAHDIDHTGKTAKADLLALVPAE